MCKISQKFLFFTHPFSRKFHFLHYFNIFRRSIHVCWHFSVSCRKLSIWTKKQRHHPFRMAPLSCIFGTFLFLHRAHCNTSCLGIVRQRSYPISMVTRIPCRISATFCLVHSWNTEPFPAFPAKFTGKMTIQIC